MHVNTYFQDSWRRETAWEVKTVTYRMTSLSDHRVLSWGLHQGLWQCNHLIHDANVYKSRNLKNIFSFQYLNLFVLNYLFKYNFIASFMSPCRNHLFAIFCFLAIQSICIAAPWRCSHLNSTLNDSVYLALQCQTLFPTVASIDGGFLRFSPSQIAPLPPSATACYAHKSLTDAQIASHTAPSARPLCAHTHIPTLMAKRKPVVCGWMDEKSCGRQTGREEERGRGRGGQVRRCR